MKENAMKLPTPFALLAAAAVLALSGCGRGPYTTEDGSLRDYDLEVVESGSGGERILLVPVHGIIASGEGSAPVAINTLRQLRSEDRPRGIRAVILHVDSPGGDVTTSDILADEVRLCREKGIKVVAFFGDTAASGAYYASAGADRIVARPTCICGSIGVIMMHFDAQKLLVDRLGVRDESIVSGPYKEVPSFFRPLKPEERAYLQNIIDHLYGRFVKVVVDGRRLKEADVRKLADGRVYTAEESLKLGLVDQIGQRDEAIAEARKLAGVEDAAVVSYRRVPSLFETLLHGESRAAPIPREVATLARLALEPKMLYLWRP
jgi:protease-4